MEYGTGRPAETTLALRPMPDSAPREADPELRRLCVGARGALAVRAFRGESEEWREIDTACEIAWLCDLEERQHEFTCWNWLENAHRA